MYWIKKIIKPLILFSTFSIISKCQAKSKQSPWFFEHRKIGKWNRKCLSVMKNIIEIAKHNTVTMRNDTKYHKAFGNAAIFSLSTSISQIMASTKANVNIILFQLTSKNVAVVHISKGISDMTPNTRSVIKYFHLFFVWK